MQEAAGGGTEQFIVTVTDDKSDKTPAEIAEAANAGKQVVLKESGGSVEQFCYLVNADNNFATFCEVGQAMEGTDDLDPIFARDWRFILNDKTIITTSDFNLPFFTIEKDTNGKYTSYLNPELLLSAAYSGCAGNVFLVQDDGSKLFGSVNLDSEDALHIYFPDYAKNKVYDFKYNDDDPVTYTFTELSLGSGGGEPLTVNITSDSSTHNLVADKTYEQIKTAFLSGKNILCVDETIPHAVINYCQFGQDYLDFYIPWSDHLANESNSFRIIWIVIRIKENNEVEKLSGNLAIPGGIPFGNNNPNKTLKTNANGAMEYVDADTYLVKQATSSESGLFLSTDGYGGQEWANPLTAGNNDSVIIKSSTPNSTKKFRITVDDAGAITATEVV